MVVESLRTELERHLANNPDENAPGGFRDRFSVIAEQHTAGGDHFPASVLEAQLHQIRDEARAAVEAHAAGQRGGTADPDAGGGAVASEGFLQRFGWALLAILILLVAAFFFLR